jgi:hypothetical protein
MPREGAAKTAKEKARKRGFSSTNDRWAAALTGWTTAAHSSELQGTRPDAGPGEVPTIAGDGERLGPRRDAVPWPPRPNPHDTAAGSLYCFVWERRAGFGVFDRPMTTATSDETQDVQGRAGVPCGDGGRGRAEAGFRRNRG